MFQDMGDVSDDGFEILRAKARLRLKEWLESGDYSGWLATPADKPETVVGGAGIQLQPILPRPRHASIIGEGRQGTIVNVFTEPQWRRRGIAGRLATKCISPAFLSSSSRRSPIGLGACQDELDCRLGRRRDDVTN
jgi:GNAT superfamily N-acetyltransferase